jgi:pimeloyl-ACP methyl ester carboxylesterase
VFTGDLAEDDKRKLGISAPVYAIYERPLSSLVVPSERIPIQKPVYFGACTKDEVCLPAIHAASVKALAKGPLTLEEFPVDHWLLMSIPDQVNGSLLKRIETL